MAMARFQETPQNGQNVHRFQVRTPICHIVPVSHAYPPPTPVSNHYTTPSKNPSGNLLQSPAGDCASNHLDLRRTQEGCQGVFDQTNHRQKLGTMFEVCRAKVSDRFAFPAARCFEFKHFMFLEETRPSNDGSLLVSHFVAGSSREHPSLSFIPRIF